MPRRQGHTDRHALAAGILGCLLSAAAGSGAWSQQLAPSRNAPTETKAAPAEASSQAKVPPVGNTTVLQRSASETKAPSTLAQVSVSAFLVEDGQRIDQGLVWRVFREKSGPEGKHALVGQYKDPSPVLKLPAGDYLVNVAFGRAHVTRRISFKPGTQGAERFVLNAGGLRVTAVANNAEPLPANAVSFEIFSDERDQSGNRIRIMGGGKPGLIIRLNSGIYQIVSTYGDANAVVRADVTVETGKMSEVTVSHAVAKATFKLVAQSGGDALSDTHWTIATPRGTPVKESVGALPTHLLAPGTYAVSAKSGGRVFRRDFTIQAGQTAQIEVVMQ